MSVNQEAHNGISDALPPAEAVFGDIRASAQRIAQLLKIENAEEVFGDMDRDPTKEDEAGYQEAFTLAKTATLGSAVKLVGNYSYIQSQAVHKRNGKYGEAAVLASANHLLKRFMILKGAGENSGSESGHLELQRARHDYLFAFQVRNLFREEIAFRTEQFDDWNDRGVFVDGWRYPVPEHLKKDAPPVTQILGAISIANSTTEIMQGRDIAPKTTEEIVALDKLAQSKLDEIAATLPPEEISIMNNFSELLTYLRTSQKSKGGSEPLEDILTPIFTDVVAGRFTEAFQSLRVARYRYAEMFSSVNSRVSKLARLLNMEDSLVRSERIESGNSWQTREKKMFFSVKRAAEDRWRRGDFDYGEPDQARPKNDEGLRDLIVTRFVAKYSRETKPFLYWGVQPYFDPISDKSVWPREKVKLVQYINGMLGYQNIGGDGIPFRISPNRIPEMLKRGKIQRIAPEYEHLINAGEAIPEEQAAGVLSHMQELSQLIDTAEDAFVESYVEEAMGHYRQYGWIPGYFMNVPDDYELTPANYEEFNDPDRVRQVRHEAARRLETELRAAERQKLTASVLQSLTNAGLGLEMYFDDSERLDKYDLLELEAYLSQGQVIEDLQDDHERFTQSEAERPALIAEIIANNRTALVMRWIKEKKVTGKIRPADIPDEELSAYAVSMLDTSPTEKPSITLSHMRSRYAGSTISEEVDKIIWDKIPQRRQKRT